MYDEESPSERAMRETKQREDYERRIQEQEAERAEWRAKMAAVNEMKAALDALYRKMRWKTETYSRPHDYTEAKLAEDMEISAWQIQGAGETLRELLPQLFWPKGTPVSLAGAVFFKRERLEAFQLDLQALIESVTDVLEDTVEPDEEEDDTEA